MATLFVTAYKNVAADQYGSVLGGVEPALYHFTVTFTTGAPGSTQMSTLSGTTSVGGVEQAKFLRLESDADCHFRFATASTASGTATNAHLARGKIQFVGIDRDGLWLSAVGSTEPSTPTTFSGVATVSGVIAVSGYVSTCGVYATPTSSPYSQAAIGLTSAGDNIVVAFGASQTIRIYQLMVNTTCQVTLKFKDGATILASGMLFNAGAGLVLAQGPAPHYVCTSSGFIINSSASSVIGGTVWYTQS